MASEGGEKWILEGDANTAFFHLMANGRRRKKKILSLETETGTTTNTEQILEQIYNFYKQLFGRQPTRHVGCQKMPRLRGVGLIHLRMKNSEDLSPLRKLKQ